jgi:aspartate ammonia-lyase
MNEILSNRATEILGGELGKYDLVTLEDVNLFQSANDVVPTAAKHSTIVIGKGLIVEAKKLLKSFQDKSKKYNKVIKLGRNHLQDSLPISFGQLFGSMASTISRDIKRINDSIENLYEVNLGTGSIGVSYYSDDKYVESILTRFNEFTGMEFRHPENTIDESRNLDEFVELGNTLKLMAINLSKTATDIRLMASGPQCGFNEVTLPAYERLDGLNCSQTSQSIPEIVNQVCFLVMGKEMSITLAAEHGEMEANAFASIIYSLIFDCLEYMRRALRLLREYCIEGMIINEEACKENIEKSDGLIVALLKKVDYQTCIDILEEKAKTGKSIKQICLDMNIMSEEKLNKLLTVENIKVK